MSYNHCFWGFSLNSSIVCCLGALFWGFPDSSAGKESACNAGDATLIHWSGRSPGEGICYPLQYSWASLVAQLVKYPSAMQETWVGKIPWRREWLPIPVFWPGELHGLYNPWNSPRQNIGVGSVSFLQGIFPTQVSCIAGGFFTS